jgi:sugar/nucleoside kinase (ribokinase family)
MTRGIFVGLSTLDLVYNVDEFPMPNAKVAARDQSIFAGGPATNAAIAFAHLGGQATLVAAVGCHPLAQVLRDELAQLSVRLVDLHPDFCGLPAVSSVTVDRAGRRNVVSANAVRMVAPAAEADPALLEEASIVLVDGHQMQACQAWAAAARSRGVPVVLDGGSWKSGTDALLAHVHTAICSADFCPPGCSGSGEVFRFLAGRGVANIAITHGAEPIDVFTGGVESSVAVPRVAVVDTMGAGDILHGAYCFYAAKGLGFAAALEAAAKVASASCRFAGTRAWMDHSD